MIRAVDIVEAVSRYTGIPVYMITGNRRSKDLVEARSYVCHLLRKSGLTLSRIGSEINRHHSSVLRLLEIPVRNGTLQEILNVVDDVENVPMWRRLGPKERLEFEDWVVRETRARKAKGERKYGDVFQGDPIQHLKEELMDAILYVWEVERMLREEKGK